MTHEQMEQIFEILSVLSLPYTGQIKICDGAIMGLIIELLYIDCVNENIKYIVS